MMDSTTVSMEPAESSRVSEEPKYQMIECYKCDGTKVNKKDTKPCRKCKGTGFFKTQFTGDLKSMI